MRVIKAKLSKSALLQAPSDELSLFVALAHLGNEITAFQKLVMWSHDLYAANEVVAHGQLSLSLMLLRILAGKLKEGYELIRTRYHGTKISNV